MLFVLNNLGIGGSERKIVRIANHLSRHGVNVRIAYLNPPDTLLDQVDPDIPLTHLHRQGKYSIKALRSLAHLAAENGEAIFAVNLYPLLYVVPAAQWPGRARLRTIGLVNTSGSTRRERWLGRIYAPLLRRCDRVVFGCAAQQALWTGAFGLETESTEVIYNGVDSDFFSPEHEFGPGNSGRHELDIPGDAVVVGSIGRLAPEKSFDLLVRAMAALSRTGRDAYLVIAGDGADRAKLEQLAETEGVAARTRFLGSLSDVRPVLKIMDMFVLPSSAVETFSNATLEAMSMARPVLLSDIGGAAEMVEHSKSGMVFPVGGVATLTEHLIALYDSPAMRKQMGSTARERVASKFTFPLMVDKYLRLARPA